jgi:hypothetical protein
MADILSLRGATPYSNEPDEEIIAKLEEILKLAKDGQIQGLLYGYVGDARGISRGWVGKADQHDMIAAVSMLHFMVLRSADGQV